MKAHELPLHKRLRRVGLSVRQFIILFAIGVIIFGAWQIIIYRTSQKAQEESTYGIINEQLVQANAFIDNYVSHIQSFIRTSAINENYFDPETHDIFLLLKNLVQSSPDIYDVFIQQADGTLVSSNHLLYNIIGNVNVEKQIARAAQRPNVILWSEPYYSRTSVNTTVCVAYAIQNSRKVIAVEVDLQRLNVDLCKVLKNKHQSFLIQSLHGNSILFDSMFGTLIKMEEEIFPRMPSSSYDILQYINVSFTPKLKIQF